MWSSRYDARLNPRLTVRRLRLPTYLEQSVFGTRRLHLHTTDTVYVNRPRAETTRENAFVPARSNRATDYPVTWDVESQVLVLNGVAQAMIEDARRQRRT